MYIESVLVPISYLKGVYFLLFNFISLYKELNAFIAYICFKNRYKKNLIMYAIVQ